ncbi:hypothetical protein M7I_7076 [Glarea lozoyensis 74030]|uniref:Clavaminate synthase-like protein n=1 Tax=Glarea lozoyensis (strain ATCC 74030 / MF5533) TaxID=1104152 RepID=H0EWB3_GLAL7|nr:hypothetical protein M7I_7076 [Glarea lozoyensis 74030]
MSSFQDKSFSNMEDLYPVPFPDDVPIAKLETISLNKLLSNNEVEAQRLFNVCKGSGFFYLDMMDHEIGRKMWEDACYACRSGQAVLPITPMTTKKAYKARTGVKVLDRGYQTGAVNDDGQPRDSEMFMVPQTEFFSNEPLGFELPPWLAPHEERFKNAMSSGNIVANVILSILEGKLELPPGALTNIHKLTDSSGDFIRVLRYPGTDLGAEIDPLRFPPHRDAVSIAILFTWLGGLQITDEEAAFAVPESSWRIEWGHNKIKALQDFIDKLQSARAGKTENLERSW